jgi:hypothetical protein
MFVFGGSDDVNIFQDLFCFDFGEFSLHLLSLFPFFLMKENPFFFVQLDSNFCMEGSESHRSNANVSKKPLSSDLQ